MLFIQIQNNTIVYPYTIQNLIKDNPNISFPDFQTLIISEKLLEEFGVFKVNYTPPPPEFDKNVERAIEDSPKNIDGKWYSSWKIEKLSNEELLIANATAESYIKTTRNELLAKSDWTQMPDVNITNKEDWAIYRQALRDITIQTGYPFNVEWPIEPTI